MKPICWVAPGALMNRFGRTQHKGLIVSHSVSPGQRKYSIFSLTF